MTFSPLKKGDTIGIVAPASKLEKKKFHIYINELERAGYKTLYEPRIFDTHFDFAGTDESRAKQVSRMFANPNVDAILCARGGYGCARTIPYLDLKTIAKNKKPFIGFSDITIYHLLFSQQLGMVTFHGPALFTGFKENRTRRTLSDIKNMLGNAAFPKKIAPLSKTKIIAHGSAKALTTGGNLTMIISSIGTPYEIDTTNKILFLEDWNEDEYRIDRMLWQLEHAGKFKSIRGLILGDLSKGKNTRIVDSIRTFFKHRSIPIIQHFPVGHYTHNRIIPINVIAEINTRKNAGLTFNEPWLG